MSISPKSLKFDDDCMWVGLDDGRIIGIPLAWFPKLLQARPEDREAFELSNRGIHWDLLDEDVSVAALLRGMGDQTRSTSDAA